MGHIIMPWQNLRLIFQQEAISNSISKHGFCTLTLLAPVSQNGQTHSNTSSAICQRIV